MSKGQESLTRSENKRFDQRKRKNKVDKILNILIAIVSILIVLNVLAIFNDDEKEQANEAVEKQNVNNTEDKEDTKNIEEQSDKNVVSAEEIETDEPNSQEENNADAIVSVQASNDPSVEEVIVDPNWKVNPTKQVGEHVSAYEKGHPDYEEKLETFRQAVQLDEDDIIFWSVKNNGSADSSVAVVSTSDKTANYRIYIEWLKNEGWKPVKVEKLKQSVGAR
ncbi:YrrS family protein [Ureibacillus aquaedulcis]|uniref:YrrS family protein n=1 Tax=Ureibacillus aquaedulcis TaxID=3058421 RepID=A0ABT8GV49_9BACL|nr:YrrS family protein [Ureibacillus sp. BA0131]MDN4495297.1 YrrS family protein [Ureibacillus sp. BA0131]